MADGAAQFLITKIYTLLENEASFLGGVSQEFYDIKLELESMKSFLRDAETRKDSISEGVKTWVKQVTDSVYDVEDIIDEFMYYIGSKRESQGFKAFIKKAAKVPMTTWLKHKYGVKLRQIRGNLKAISERSKDYSFCKDVAASMTRLYVPSGHDQLQQERELSRFLGNNEIVGVEEDTKLLLKWLMEEEPQRTLISVVGMGGSGKTTLVSKVYKSDEVKRHFDCYTWVTVSKTYVIEDLCRKMIKELSKSLKKEVSRDLMSTMDYPELVEMLDGLIQHNRYLVVLDDVWRTDVWKKLRVALSDGGRGSRVLLTTREKGVASHSFGVGMHVHHLPPLKEHEAWTLFCQKTFYNDETSRYWCPPELEEVASCIVRKCKGLPLALVSMGGLMSSQKRLPSEWMKVYSSMNWLLGNDPKLNTVKAILFLSYNDLPYHLKHCFLYCSIFPEDYEIKRSRLIRLWIAEGLIGKREGATLEDVAYAYLEELIARCMLQIVTNTEAQRLQRDCCSMHDVIRELAISTAREQNLCTVLDVSSLSTSSDQQQGEVRNNCYRDPRRLSLIKGGVVDLQSLEDISRLRSLLMFVQQSGNITFSISPSPSTSSSSISLVLPPGFRLLRVLDLEDVPIAYIPEEELGNLFSLHYLNLRKTNVKALPNSIGKLQRLQTLDIRYSKVDVLPDEIVNCQKLRHLLAGYHVEKPAPNADKYSRFKGVGVPSDIWKLKNLQVLSEIELRSDGTTSIIKGIGSMTQLRRLQITQVRQVDVMELCAAIQQLRLLYRLSVVMCNETETLGTTDHLMNPPPLLQKLVLAGKLDKFPRWVSLLNNLTSLCLYWSQLREDADDRPLMHISTLPCLEHLYLWNVYDGEQLCFRKGWFPKLKTLYMKKIPNLNEIVIEQGAITNLGRFAIVSCRKLKEAPHGIQHLAKLKEFVLFDMPRELVEGLRPGGADAPKVRHVLQVGHAYHAPTGELHSENLTSSLPSPSSSSEIQVLTYKQCLTCLP